MAKDKWKTLSHKGPLFPKAYVYKGLSCRVNGKHFVFTPETEEMAWAWVSKLDTPYVKDKTFQKNFWSCFSKVLPPEVNTSKFPEDWDFSEIQKVISKEKESKKQNTGVERKAEKEERDKLKAVYGKAILNGIEVDLGAYVVEPAGLFMGRGQHPKRGTWKPSVYAEDIILNMTKVEKVPPAPAGHKWGEIVENKGALWTAMWRDCISGGQKRVLFGVTSFVKQGADQKKFQKAIDLANNFDKVIRFIDKGLNDKNTETRKIATVAKIISTLAIRVGDEKGKDTAETFGAVSLQTEHIKIDGNKIEFDFLGKDSVRYHNIVEFDDATIRNVKEFATGKKKGEKIFEDVSSPLVSIFLSGVQPGLTAKQFRTAIGSTLLAKSLRSKVLDPSLKDGKKLEFFTHASLEVSLQLNHQSAVSAAYDASLDRMKDTLKSVKTDHKELKKNLDIELSQLKATKDERVAFAKERWVGEKQKVAVKRANDWYKKAKEKLEKKVQKTEEKIDTLDAKTKIKEKTRGVALGTARANYSDPRIIVSWCKDNNVDLKRIYPATAQKKFSWALDVDADFYKKYPIV